MHKSQAQPFTLYPEGTWREGAAPRIKVGDKREGKLWDPSSLSFLRPQKGRNTFVGEETSSPATFPSAKVTQTKLGEQRVNIGCDARVHLLLFCCLDYLRDHLGTEASRIKRPKSALTNP